MSEPTQARLPALDGLRACAILLVLLHHGLNFELGWAGVHLFFVLSGFLITGILRRERADTHFWGSFYLKRATRILPALLVLLLMCGLLGELHFDARTAGFVFFGANIVQSLGASRMNDLTILWSLAVEEHFYVLWPFAIRYLTRRGVVLLAAAIVVLSPLLRAWATPLASRWDRIYMLTPFQLDGLAMGALLAVLLEHDAWRVRLAKMAWPVMLPALALLVWLSHYAWFQREANTVAFNAWGYTLVVLIAACALLLALRPGGVAARVLSLRPIVWLGAISYGVYLYQGPMAGAVLLLRERTHLSHGRLVGFAIPLVLLGTAALSFRLYEQPITRWGRRRARQLGDSSHRDAPLPDVA